MTSHPYQIHPSHTQYWQHQGLSFPIYGTGAPLSKKQHNTLKALLAVLEHGLTKYAKLFMVRIEITPNRSAENNESLSQCLKLLIPQLKSLYGCEVFYFWVREHASTDTHHYHLALFLSGHKIQHPHSLITAIQQSDSAQFARFTLAPKSYYMIKPQDAHGIMAAFYRLSYLAKSDTKQKKPHTTKSYGCNLSQRVLQSRNKISKPTLSASPETEITPQPIPLPPAARQIGAVIDFSRTKVLIHNKLHPQPLEAFLFIGIMAESGYLFAYCSEGNQLADWLQCQQAMFQAIGGVPHRLYHARFNPKTVSEYGFFTDMMSSQSVHSARTHPLLRQAAAAAKHLHQQLNGQKFSTHVELQHSVTAIAASYNNTASKRQTHRADFVTAEQPFLQPLAPDLQPIQAIKQVKVGTDCHVSFEQHFYSVPARQRGQQLWLTASDHQLQIMDASKNPICQHPRKRRWGYSTVPEHMPPTSDRFSKNLEEGFIRQAAKISAQLAQKVFQWLGTYRYPEQAYRKIQSQLAQQRKLEISNQ